jgi:hypothetical protein
MTNQTDRDNASGGPDDAWKQQVREENAELDRQAAAAASSESAGKSGNPERMPPADFGTLVNMLSMQAMVALGLIPHPASNQSEFQPTLARHFIDLLNVIETKTKGNLDREESMFLEETLHHLRMTFVELSKK